MEEVVVPFDGDCKWFAEPVQPLDYAAIPITRRMRLDMALGDSLRERYDLAGDLRDSTFILQRVPK